MFRLILFLVLSLGLFISTSFAVIHHHSGGEVLPHEKYVHVVSQMNSPVEEVYIRTEDGLYVAAALRKPEGAGPFPALIYFHGAPGGRGIEQLVGWSRGDHGGPVWERFLQEGFVVVVADYRRHPRETWTDPLPDNRVTYVDDGFSVVQFVKALTYVDESRVTVYGVSLGGNLALYLTGRTQVRNAILGAPAAMAFLGAQPGPGSEFRPPMARFADAQIDLQRARKNIERIKCPVLILAGTKDRLIPINRKLHDLMEQAGKQVRMDVYENGYHDFVVGPQGHEGRDEPLLDATLDALELSITFAKGELSLEQ